MNQADDSYANCYKKAKQEFIKMGYDFDYITQTRSKSIDKEMIIRVVKNQFGLLMTNV